MVLRHAYDIYHTNLNYLESLILPSLALSTHIHTPHGFWLVLLSSAHLFSAAVLSIFVWCRLVYVCTLAFLLPQEVMNTISKGGLK